MAFILTRQQAYDFAWSRPMRDLAEMVGISDVALAKSLRKAGIPLPARGYWNKLSAGQPVRREALPQEDLGTAMVVRLGGRLPAGSPFHEYDPPADPTDITLLASRFRSRMGSVKLPTLATLHPEVRTLIARKERLEAKWSSSSFASAYQSPLKDPRERRRLQLVNGLLLIAEKYGQGGYLRSEYGSVKAYIQFGGLPVECRFEYSADGSDQLTVTLHGSDVTGGAVFADGEGLRIESQLADLIVAIARIGVEIRRWLDLDIAKHRERIAKQAMELKQRSDAAAVAAAEREQRLQVERRLTALLRAATNLNRAANIRAMVASVEDFAAQQGSAGTDWVSWALAQADRIDPTKNGDLEASIRESAQRRY